MPSENFIFLYLISKEVYKNAKVYQLVIQRTGEIWASIKDVGSGMGFKNISDLGLKGIHGILKTKNPTKEQINEYKMTEREIYKKFCNLSEEKLNTKSNKNVYMKNIVMTAIIKRCRSKKKRGIRAINGFTKKTIPNSEISGCPEFEVKNRKVVYE